MRPHTEKKTDKQIDNLKENNLNKKITEKTESRTQYKLTNTHWAVAILKLDREYILQPKQSIKIALTDLELHIIRQNHTKISINKC